MKIRVLSDLHLEFLDWVPPKLHADIVVLAGDIHVGVRGIEWARRSFPLNPVIYVPGNHEFYGRNMQDVSEELLVLGRRLGVDVLNGRSAVIGSTDTRTSRLTMSLTAPASCVILVVIFRWSRMRRSTLY
jgi:predicted phosphodiesterase